ncbi:MAG: hypothetical protein LBE10_02220 [Treponema sp.]|jgi:hypothetical protein|nr:hypothetical protein [Treponema sp.]
MERKQEFKRVADIMDSFGGAARRVYPPTRGLTTGGHLVHVIIIGNRKMANKGVTNGHGPGISWDDIYINSEHGGLNPAQHPIQAMFVKDQTRGERNYTFRGVYKADIAGSDEFKITYRRIVTTVDETAEEWRIVGFV